MQLTTEPENTQSKHLEIKRRNRQVNSNKQRLQYTTVNKQYNEIEKQQIYRRLEQHQPT